MLNVNFYLEILIGTTSVSFVDRFFDVICFPDWTVLLSIL